MTIEGTPLTAATATDGLYCSERARGHVHRHGGGPAASATPRELRRVGPTTLDFTLPRRSDAFGHTCELEDAPFEERTRSLPITGTSGVGTIDLPFPFTFYGFTYTQAHVCANGFVEFVGPATTNCSSTNVGDPDDGAAERPDRSFWDDLVIDASASIRADVEGLRPTGAS